MTAALAELGRRFHFNRGTIDLLTAGYGPGEWARKPAEGAGNPAHWIVGHLAMSRRELARRLGADVPKAPWEELFQRKLRPAGTEGYPAPELLLEDLRERGKELTRLLGELDAEQAAESWEGFPDGSETVAAGAHFYHFHESYHVGQLGMLRRLNGLEGIV